MNNGELSEQFRELSSPLIADASLRLRVPIFIAPPGIQPVIPGTLPGWTRFAGEAFWERGYFPRSNGIVATG
jgi:hypothetical protein